MIESVPLQPYSGLEDHPMKLADLDPIVRVVSAARRTELADFL